MFFFSVIVFDFAGLFLVPILVRNLYTGEPCETMRSLPLQTKSPSYGPAFHMKMSFSCTFIALKSNSFTYQSVKGCFETEGKGNSEMTYSHG